MRVHSADGIARRASRSETLPWHGRRCLRVLPSSRLRTDRVTVPANRNREALMTRELRGRFWVEAGLALISGALVVITLVWRDWIEIVFGIDPDEGNGCGRVARSSPHSSRSHSYPSLGWRRIEWRRTAADRAARRWLAALADVGRSRRLSWLPVRSRSRNWPAQSAFVFVGKVAKTKAATMQDLVAPDTAIVEVEHVLNAPDMFATIVGQQVTVRTHTGTALKRGERRTFFANGWVFGTSLAVDVVGHGRRDGPRRHDADAAVGEARHGGRRAASTRAVGGDGCRRHRHQRRAERSRPWPDQRAQPGLARGAPSRSMRSSRAEPA